METHISPLELLKTPPDILLTMCEIIWPKGDVKTGAEAWQGLAAMAFD